MTSVADPHGAEQPLRRFRFPDGHLGWFTTKHSSCRAIMQDRRFSVYPMRPLAGSDGGFQDALAGPEHIGDLLRLNPPEHTKLRRYLAPFFTLRRAEEKRPMVERVVAECIRSMKEAGPPLDFVHNFAIAVPSIAICEFLGLDPSWRSRYEAPTEALEDMTEASTPADKLASVHQLYDFASEVIDDKRANPADDLLTEIIVRSGLTDTELRGLLLLLFIAGHGTTALNFTAGVCGLLSRRERWETARADLDSIDRTVEEILRYSMTTNADMPRTALEDIEIDGVLIKAGETVAVVPGRPGGDLATEPDLCRFDPGRDAGRHLAFGHGIHMCLGQHLARLELAVGFEGLLREFPSLALAEPLESIRWYRRGTGGFDHSGQLMRDPLLVAW